MIEYKSFDAVLYPQARSLYEKEGWRAYLQDDPKLERAFACSLYLYGAFDEERLVGFVRCVGDGEHILLVQDLIVDPAYRRQGIGRRLFQTVWDRYVHVRMFMVITDRQDPVDNAFYRSFGMKLLEQGQMVGYFR